MEIKFVGIEKPVNINFQDIKEYVKNDIKSAYGDNISDEMIYEAFKKNPAYYLIKLYFKNDDLNVFENNTVIHFIVDKFFWFTIKNEVTQFYVLKDGRVLDKFDTKDLAEIYAKHVGGYIMDAN